MVVVGWMVGQFFLHMDLTKLDKFIVLFYNEERESIIIWAELVLKEMTLRFRNPLK